MAIALDGLARISQEEFTAIRSEMKDGFERVQSGLKTLDDKVDALDDKVESGFSSLAQILKSI